MSRLFISRSLILVLALSSFGCSGEPTASPEIGGVDRETFIATYVDLRTTVIRGESHQLSDAERAKVLSDHGVTEQDLMTFAEVYGQDVDFMRGIWDEVEARLEAVRVAPGAVDPT